MLCLNSTLAYDTFVFVKDNLFLYFEQSTFSLSSAENAALMLVNEPLKKNEAKSAAMLAAV